MFVKKKEEVLFLPALITFVWDDAMYCCLSAKYSVCRTVKFFVAKLVLSGLVSCAGAAA